MDEEKISAHHVALREEFEQLWADAFQSLIDGHERFEVPFLPDISDAGVPHDS